NRHERRLNLKDGLPDPSTRAVEIHRLRGFRPVFLNIGICAICGQNAYTALPMPRRASNLQATEKGLLDSRAEILLAALIKEHLVTGEAVGSRVLSDRFAHGYGWSPATIRNVMGELEEAGFVDQPHTSAGRVPTDKGYRYYVDNILGDARLSRSDLRAIDQLFAANETGSSP